MENTLPASDDEEEEDWMAINWNGNLPSGTKLLHSKNSLDDTESLSKGLWTDAGLSEKKSAYYLI